jgi:hypothetical protein
MREGVMLEEPTDIKNRRRLFLIIGIIALALAVLSQSSFAATPTCVNNWQGGTCLGSITYTSNTMLSNNINASGNLTINTGVSLTLNGSGIWIGGLFTDNGVLNSGLNILQSKRVVSVPNSYGGSGGGGGSYEGGCSSTCPAGTSGGNSRASGGSGGGPGGGNGNSGSATSAPSVTNSLIQVIETNSFASYLQGAAGGSGGSGFTGGGSGGWGSYGGYVQANSINTQNGIINSTGQQGFNAGSYLGGTPGGGGGGAGSGSWIFAYNSQITLGTETISGGSGSPQGSAAGGNGGAGTATSFQYIVQPLKTVTGASSTPNLTISNTLIDQGQVIKLTATTTGVSPFTYNYQIVNAITGATIANQLYTSVASASNTFIWNPSNALYTSNTFKANVIVTDSTPTTTNSVFSFIGYNSQASIGLSANNAILRSGQTQSLNFSLSTGTSPYLIRYFNSTGSKNYSFQTYGGWLSQTFPTPSTQASCVMNGNNMICVGGHDFFGYAQVYEAPVFANLTIGKWIAQNTIFEQTSSPFGDTPYCTIYSGYIDCIVGSASNNVSFAKIFSGGTLSTWNVSNNGMFNSTLTSNTFQGCTTVYNYVYCVGSYDASGNAHSDAYYAKLMASGGFGVWQSTTSYPVIPVSNFGVLSCYTVGNNVYCTDSGGDSYYAPVTATNTLGSWVSTSNNIKSAGGSDCVVNLRNVYCFSPFGASSYNAVTYNAVVLPSNILSTVQTTQYHLPVGLQEVSAMLLVTNTLYNTNTIYSIGGGTGGPLNFTSGVSKNNIWYATVSNSGISTSNSVSFTVNTISNANVFNFNVIGIDSASTPVTFNSVKASFTVNLPISTPTLALSNALMDQGQSITLSSYVTNGMPSYTYNFLIFNSVSGAVIANSLQTTNSVTFASNALWTSSSPIRANVIVTDTSAYTLSSANSANVYINGTLTIPAILASITPQVQSGQTETFTGNFFGGTSPFTYNFQVVNAQTLAPIANMLILGSSARTNTFVWLVPAADVGNQIEVNVIVTDSATSNVQVNSIYSSVINIVGTYIPPPTPTISLSNTLLDAGQLFTATSSVIGGNTPYTYNWIVINSVTGAIVANALYTSVSSTTNTFAFTTNANMVGQTLEANLIVTDAHPTTVNSVYSPFGVNTLLTVSSVGITPLATSQAAGNPVTFTATVTAGTSTYGYDWTVIDANNNIVFNTGSFSGTSTLVFTVPYGSTFGVNVLVKDSATTAVTVNSISATLTGVSNAGGGGGGGGGSPSTTVPQKESNNSTATGPLTVPLIIPGEALFTTILKYMFQTTYDILGSAVPIWLPVELFIIALGLVVYKAQKNKAGRHYYGFIFVLAIVILFLYLASTLP